MYLLDNAYALGDLLELGTVLVAAGLYKESDYCESIRLVLGLGKVLVLGIVVDSVRLHRILHALQRVLAPGLITVGPMEVKLFEHIHVGVQGTANDIRLLFALAERDHGRGAGVLDTGHAHWLPVAMIFERINIINMLDGTIAYLDGRLHGHAIR